LQKPLQEWLRINVGAPSVELTKPVTRRKLLRLKGIIGFMIPFNDATGHIDLWDGNNFNLEPQAHSDYFAGADQVVLWRVRD
jgi:hypothetical protein